MKKHWTTIVLAIGLIAALFLLNQAAPKSTVDSDKTFNRIVTSKTIRCGYLSWAPAFIKDPNTGALSGINYEFMEAIARELGFKVEWVEEIGIGAVPEALSTGRIDVMCASMWPDAAKMPHAEFTLPTYYSAAVAWARADDMRFDGDLAKADTPDVRACGIEGDITLNALMHNFSKTTFVGVSSSSDGATLINHLVSNKCDFILIDDPLGNSYNAQNPGTIRKIADVGPVRVYGEHLLVPAGELRLKGLLDTVIMTLINSGTMDRILTRYPGVFAAPEKTYKPL